MWKLGGLSPAGLVRSVVRHCGRDEILGRAGELAYFFLLSAFPLLLVLTVLLGQLVDEGTGLHRALLDSLQAVTPDQAAFELLRDNLAEISDAGGGKLSLSILLAIWASSRGMDAVGRGLARAFETRYVRPLWARKAVALGLTLTFAVLTAAGLALVFYGGAITRAVAGRMDFGGSFLLQAWSWLQRPMAVAFVLLGFDLIYNFAAGGLRRRGVRWVTPGACAAVVIWLVASFGFKIYLSQVAFYARIYGSLGAVIILLLWFYLTGFAILVGAEVNAAIFRAEKEPSG